MKRILTQVDIMNYDHLLNVGGEVKGEAKMTEVPHLRE